MKATFRGVVNSIVKRRSSLSAKNRNNVPQDTEMPTQASTDYKLQLPHDFTTEQLTEFRAFTDWKAALQKSLGQQSDPNHEFHADPYKLRSINVQAVDWFGSGKIGFVKLKADVSNGAGEKLPGSVFMRGGSVAMLLILSPESSQNINDQWVVLTQQPRIPAGSLAFVEIPAGTLDGSGNFAGTAAREILEETGLVIEESELHDMSKLTQQIATEESSAEIDDILQDAVYPTPGGSDEYIPLLMARKVMSVAEIKALQGKLTGLRKEGEKISLRLVKLQDAWKVAARDAKALSALHLYEQLSRAGRL